MYGSDNMRDGAVSEKGAERPLAGRKRSSKKRRSESLLLATDSAIDRLKALSQPGGEIEQMDIKDLKNLISSIKELSAISDDLSEDKAGGVVILPEVKIDE